MIDFIKTYYLTDKILILLLFIVLLFIFGFYFESFYYLAYISLSVVSILIISDIVILYRITNFNAERIIPERLSNGDDNSILIILKNDSNYELSSKIIDEIPYQFQNRNFEMNKRISPKTDLNLSYNLVPHQRGVYKFGNLNIYIKTFIGLGERRLVFSNNAQVQVYPSFINLKYYHQLKLNSIQFDLGLKEVRKTGHSMEFEHIRNYLTGDDFRSINWKASARRNELMVNQFIDERSQNIYSVIDTGRNMKMPFNGLALLDYSINTSLAVSTVIQKKYDKCGLITFSNKIESFIKTSKQSIHIGKIMEALYKVETNYFESDFEILYSHLRRNLNHRSLLLIFTNFESISSMRKNLPYIKLISKFHLPLIIFFENTELTSLLNDNSKNVYEIYQKVAIEQYLDEKYEIINELRLNGIMSILTKPENLTTEVINKYLEIKSRRMI